MGRHTADTGSVRAPRQGETLRQEESTTAFGERRAALHRTRTAETSDRPVNPVAAQVAPVSVAANRVSDTATIARAETTHGVPAAPSEPRIVRRRRSVATRPVTATKPIGGLSAAVRRGATIPALSFAAVSCFVVGSMVNPAAANATTAASAVVAPARPAAQVYTAHGTYADFDVTRDAYGVTKPKPKPKPVPVATATPTADASASTDPAAAATTNTAASSTGFAPAAATPDPGSAQAIGLELVTQRGWGQDQYSCLVSLWNKESGWRVNAYNPSGAYGIPQALPGSKMASAGADWQTNPATQITWGLNYITAVYGTPCGAWGHSQNFNWY